MGEETLSKREIRGMGKIRRALVEWEKVIRAFYGETFLVERLMFFFFLCIVLPPFYIMSGFI